MKTTADKNPEGFNKVGGKGKGGKRPQKKINEEKQSCHNSFKILEEEDENKETNQEMENTITEKERDESMEEIIEIMMEINKDHEMTPSEVGTENHELREILERENIDLEKLLEQGTTKGVDYLPKEEYDKVQQLFLWRSQSKGNRIKRNHEI